MSSLVLVLNCGSSSIKFATVNPETAEMPFSGLVQCIASPDANIGWKLNGNKQKQQLPDINYHEALDFILNLLRDNKELFDHIIAVGHRVVHGGENFTKSAVIDDAVLTAIRACQNLAPLHNPANIQGILATKKMFPSLTQVAVFDTAFHQSMPKEAFLYALPYELYEKHQIRRYGFHGTSHLYVSRQAAKVLDIPYEEAAFITAHLGNGCSTCAILNGKSMDTSMGLTPLEGLVMGTRSGDMDPSIHEHLVDRLGYDIHKVTKMLNKESGLLGISGIDSDCRTLEEGVENGNERATLAMEIFCYRLTKYIASYAAVIGRIDALIFTGGIGENSSYVRETVLKRLKILGFELDSERNNANGKNSKQLITKDGSTKALVIPTNEELVIAQDAAALSQE